MTRVRWYIGKVDRNGADVPVAAQESAIDTLAEVFGGATVYHTVGIWRGARELSLVVEVLTSGNPTDALLHPLALHAAQVCNQSAVMYTCEPGITTRFAETDG